MEIQDIKILFINGIALGLSMTQLEVTLKIVLLAITIGYTISKWVKLKEKK